MVQMGAGESDLDSLTLTGLKLQMGPGETTVDLTGDYAKGFDASIQGGVDEATVPLPRHYRRSSRRLFLRTLLTIGLLDVRQLVLAS